MRVFLASVCCQVASQIILIALLDVCVKLRELGAAPRAGQKGGKGNHVRTSTAGC